MAVDSCAGHCPLHKTIETDDNENKKERKKKKERFYIFTGVTRTHTHPV